jgi:glycosyltransferase involved in cell wall biosynthesis
MVSIITPAYNSEKYIAETILSVLAQSYQNWEMIIVDDSSTDKTAEIISSFKEKDSRIKYIYNSTNKGSAYSRNVALQKAKGKWIAFLDSDDLWHPKKLEKQIEFMKKNNYHFSYTNYCEIDENSKEKGILISGPKTITEKMMRAYYWPGCLTVMYDVDKTGLIQSADLEINEELENAINEFHKLKKQFTESLDTVNTIDKFNRLKDCWLNPIWKRLNDLEDKIQKLQVTM